MKHSIFQDKPVKARGDYDMINIDSFICFLEEQGYSPVIDNNKGNYKEQSYREKSKQRKTAFHGQFRLNFLKPNCRVGLAVFSSNDCQLPFMLFAGPVVGNDVIPVTKILSVKHIKTEIDRIDCEVLEGSIVEHVLETERLLKKWEETPVQIKHIVAAFKKTNDYKTSIMNCLRMHSLKCANKLELFQALIDSFIYGNGESETGRKPRELTHLRRHLQLSDFIVKVLA